MSIATAIQAAQQKVANAYSSVSSKGGTLPSTQNLSNLPSAIESIPSGSGGTEVDACALRGAQSYIEGDKALLLPSDLFTKSTAILTQDETEYWRDIGYELGMSVGGFCTTQEFDVDGRWGEHYYTHVTAKNDLEKFNVNIVNGTGSSRTTIYHRDNLNVAVKGANIGYYKDGYFKTAYTLSSNHEFNIGYDYYNSGLLLTGSHYGPDELLYCDGETVTRLMFGESKASLNAPLYAKWNGQEYLCFCTSNVGVYSFDRATKTISTTKSYDLTGSFLRYSYDYYYPVDNEGDCFLFSNNDDVPSGGLKYIKWANVTKSSEGWTVSEDVAKSDLLWSCVDGKIRAIFTRDFGDVVKIAIIGSKITADKGAGYFEYDKTTKTLTRLKDLLSLPDLPLYTNCCNVNFEDGIAVIFGSFYENGVYSRRKVYVTMIPKILPYKYVAVPPDKGYYENYALTGYTTENLGVDSLGNTALKVVTAEDPNAEPWTDIGKLFGFNVTVTPGEE